MQNTSALTAISWSSGYASLGDEFFSYVSPTPISKPYWVHINHDVANILGTSAQEIKQEDNLLLFSGATTIPHNTPIAMVYAGHQFGGYSPRLGDGRGVLLGQVKTSVGIRDLHLKGAGKTPYSRFGDGRAVLRSSIREYIAGEAMHALGIASTRALCITASDDAVIREQPETAAMLTRIAKTHIRFGHFEYFHYQHQFAQVKQLADHVIQQFLPEQRHDKKRYFHLLRYSVEQTAIMIAHWQSVGFAHGVMNTDNMSIIGETLDYGPYGFLDDYEPTFICNHSDHTGRYAFDQQPSIGLWNLQALAQALSSLLSDEEKSEAIAYYEPTLINTYAHLMRQKFGWHTTQEEDKSLCANILHLLAQDKVDYTIFFRRLCDVDITAKQPLLLDDLFTQKDKWQAWLQQYQKRLKKENMYQQQRQEQMKKTNPKFILRNYLLQQAIDKAQNKKDFSMIDQLMRLVKAPYDEWPEDEIYALSPPNWGKHLPISCSS